MAQIIWTEPALSDLEEIAEYIALDDVEAAKRLVRQVFSTVGRLERHPTSGRVPPELEKKSRYREVIVGPCRIFHRVEGDKVFILFVMRVERQLRLYLLNERDKEKA